MNVEVWKDIPSFEGIYEASTHGKIRTHKDKTTYTKRHGVRKWKQRILKFKGSNPKTGYRVTLWKDGKPKDFLVARLIGTTFLENLIDTNMTINHKNGDRFYNFVVNIEWVSLADNIRHAFDTGLMPYKQVKVTNLETKEEFVLRSMAMAGKHIGRSLGYISGKLKKGINHNDKWKWELL